MNSIVHNINFLRNLYSYKILIFLSIFPLIILGFSSQGNEILILVLERLDFLESRGTVLLFFAFFFYFLTLYLIKSGLLIQKSENLPNGIAPILLAASILPIGLSLEFLIYGQSDYRYYIFLSIMIGYLHAIDVVEWKFILNNKFLCEILHYTIPSLIVILAFILSLLFFVHEPTSFKYILILSVFFLIYLSLNFNKNFKIKHSNSIGITILVSDKEYIMYFELFVIVNAISRLIQIYYSNSAFYLFCALILVSVLLSRLWIKNKNIHLQKYILSFCLFINIFFLTDIIIDAYIPKSMTNLLFGYTAILMIIWNIYKIDYKFKGSASISIIFILVIFQFFNDNTRIPIIKNEVIKNQKLDNNISNWLDKTGKKQITTKEEKKTRIYVTLIASEGGGIRSAFWTTGLLFKLDSLFPNIMNYNYAISSVSGGSVGAMYYFAIKDDMTKYGLSNRWHQILGGDYLGDVTLGLTIGNTIQTFLPFPIHSLDRSTILSNDWKKQYNQFYASEHSNLNTLNKSIYSFHNDSLKYKTPNIFFNSTHVESGRKTIISNLNLNNHFNQDLILMEKISSPISINTAAMLSARFPLVTPSGLAVNLNNVKIGRFVDGGYYDNSGLVTLMDLANILSNHSTEEQEVIPILIFFRNGDLSEKNKTISTNSLSGINAFLNSWNSRTERTVKEIQEECNNKGYHFYEINLNHNKLLNDIEYPLGWTLSRKSQQSILSQINQLGISNFSSNNNTIKKLQKLDSSISVCN